MKKILIFFLLMLAVLGGAWLYHASKESSSVHAEKKVYQCPMHPQIVQDHPGNCPVCGMKLVEVQSAHSSHNGNAAAAQLHNEKNPNVLFYRNPMDPAGTSPVPMKDSMGMDYIPVYDDENPVMPESDVPGHAPVRLASEKQQIIGIKTETASKSRLKLPLRLTGTVFHNHEIFELLSQYREALQVEKRYKKPTYELVVQSRSNLFSLRNKLRRMGLTDEDFQKAEESLADPTSFVPSHLLIDAGGAYVDARLPVSELAHVKLGQNAVIYSPMAPGQKIEGVLRSLDSVVDAPTQTLGLRFEASSGHEFLKPGMFVAVEMEIDLGESLSVSSAALFSPGKNAYVFVEKEDGIFVPRKVAAGVSASDRVQIVSGLEEGEKVVTAANFLLDSESRFQAARAMQAEGGLSHD